MSSEDLKYLDYWTNFESDDENNLVKKKKNSKRPIQEPKKERSYTQRDVDNIRATMRKQLERMKMQFDIKQQESLQFVKD